MAQGPNLVYQPKRAFATVATGTTDGNVVTAVSGKKIRVLASATMAAGTATAVTFNSKGSGAGTAISATFTNGVNGGEVLPYNPVGWFETNAGEALTVTTAAAGSNTAVHVVYCEV